MRQEERKEEKGGDLHSHFLLKWGGRAVGGLFSEKGEEKQISLIFPPGEREAEIMAGYPPSPFVSVGGREKKKRCSPLVEKRGENNATNVSIPLTRAWKGEEMVTGIWFAKETRGGGKKSCKLGNFFVTLAERRKGGSLKMPVVG